MAFYAPGIRSIVTLGALAAAIGGGVLGCVNGRRAEEPMLPEPARQVVVVAPVLNLSGTHDLDPLKITDIVASEFLSFPAVSVVPVNLTMAALAGQGKAWVETPEDAISLARELGADATVVVAVTEYRPHDPPVVGLVMQWYAIPRSQDRTGLNPVVASRGATGPPEVELSAMSESGPRFQLQRVFNAAHDDVLREVREFAGRRGGHQSPFGWRIYTKSQELYVRYCTWALIGPMLRLSENGHLRVAPVEAS